MYPTFASQDPRDPERWVVRLRGWVHRPRELGIKRLAAVVALAHYYRVRPDEYDIFLRRIYPFVVRNRAGREVDLVCSHLGSSYNY